MEVDVRVRYKILSRFTLIYFCENPTGASAWIGAGYLLESLQNITGLELYFKAYRYEQVQLAVSEMVNSGNDILGLSILQHNIVASKIFLESFSQFKGSTHVTVGNIEPSINPEYFLDQVSGVDSVIIGEGEITIRELCTRIIENRTLEGCKGIYYKKGDKIICNQLRELIADLDSLPFPTRHYSNDDMTVRHIIGSRGCLGNCSFCVDNAIYKKQPGKKNRIRSITNIVDEIEWLVKNKKTNFIDLYDSTFCSISNGENAGYERLSEFYSELNKRKIWVLFTINLRAEQITEETVKILKLLKRVGLSTVFIGVESGNVEDLKLYNKIATIEDNIEAIRLLRRNDINIRYGFINFNPYSTLDRLVKNVKFLKDSQIDITFSELTSRLQLYSGTPIVKKLAEDKLLLQKEDEPIVETYGYIYKQPIVEKIYRMLQICEQRIINNFGDIEQFNMQLYEHLLGNDATSSLCRECYRAYRKRLTEICIESFEIIINHIIEDEGVLRKRLDKNIVNWVKELEELEKKFNDAYYDVRIKLYELDEIIW